MKRLVLPIAVSVALAFGAGVSLARASRPAGVMEALQRAQPERVFVARFSTDTKYHACTADPAFADSLVPRETCAPRSRAPLDLLDEMASAGESLDPDSLRGASLVALLWGDAETASDDAVEFLSRAKDLARESVSALVDLSASHLARAERTGSSLDVLLALNHAEHAVQLDPGNLHALFNSAYAAQVFGLRDVAIVLWERYLTADSTSEWADEVRGRRDALRAADAMPLEPVASSPEAAVQAFAARQPQQARELGWSVLGRWGRAMRKGNAARADSMLLLAERLGTAIHSRAGDASLIDAVRAIRAAGGDASAVRRLAGAHSAFADGLDEFKTGNWSQARDSFASALRHHPASPALLAWARAEYGVGLWAKKKEETARRVIFSVAPRLDPVRYPALHARVQWVRAKMLPSDSAAARRMLYDSAGRTYARLGEWESFGAARYLHAWGVHGTGDAALAYRMMSEALRMVRPYRLSTQLHNVLLHTAELASKDGMPWAARLVQEEDYGVALRNVNPTVPVEALQARARMRTLADSTELASRDLQAALELIPELPENHQKAYLQITQRYARVLASRRASNSIAVLDSAIDSSKATSPEWYYASLLLRAELLLNKGDLPGADADLDTLTSRISKVSRQAAGFHLRAAVLERMRRRYDQLVMAYVRKGELQLAFEALERSRVSFAPEPAGRVDGRTWTAPRPGQVVLEYALIGDTLLTWVVGRDSLTLHEQRLSRDSLLRTIARVDVGMESTGHDAAVAPGLRGLYDVLIRPVQKRVPAGSELVIVADGEIAGVPFEALMKDARHYLLEDHPISYALALRGRAASAFTGSVDGRVLLVADPDFDRGANPELDGLPGAEQEVNSLREIYEDAATVLGADSATAAALERHARGVRVIHYAGHAVFDNSRPERSFLLLAGAGTAGRLTADSVNTMDLNGVGLVVLSACQAVRGREGRSGGFAGLSGALLNAGADGVVASLWQVNDRLAQPLMVEFHRRYNANPDPVRALQAARLHMLRTGTPAQRSPAAWAGFRYLGR